MTENRLAMQARAIMNKQWLTVEELDEIKTRETEGEGPVESVIVIEDISETVMAIANERSTVRGEQRDAEGIPRNDNISVENLTQEKQELIERIKNIREGLQEERKRLPNIRHIDKRKLVNEIKKINEIADYIPVENITDLNDTFYASAVIVTEKLAKDRSERKVEEPAWKVRLKRKVEELQQDLSRLEEARNRNFNDRLKRKMEKKFNIKRKGYQQVIEELKQRLIATAVKIKRYEDRVKQYQQNRMFENNQKRFYENIQKNSNESEEPPDAEEAKTFWQGIWGCATKHNDRAPWIGRVEDKLKTENQEEITITERLLKKALVKLPNWKAPGPDAVQGFWIKQLTKLHSKMAQYLNECLETAHTPEWMTSGRTVLIQKDKEKGTVPGNYRPITCLPIVWKVLTSILSDEIYRHLEDSNLIGEEQKGCRRGYRGTKDHLMLDKVILKDCKRRKTNLAMGWIDYQKAYDLIPHSWIMETMRMVGVAEGVRNMLRSSMKRWKTTLESAGQSLATVEIQRGIFQGDSLSPLLFVVSLIPLSVLLREARQGYELGRCQSGKINHLLYMDDLKLFGKTKSDLESLVQTVRIYTEDIRMRFGLQKCATLTMKRGKRAEDIGIWLPDGQMMNDLGENGYKYLGILESDAIKEKEMKEKVAKEYKRRIKLILESKLNGGNAVKAINTWAVAVLRYTGGILDWNKEELQNMDRKTRKIMTMNGALHPRASVARLYLARDEGGRGMKSVEEVIRTEEYGLSDYIKNEEKGYNKLLKTLIKDQSKNDYTNQSREKHEKEWTEKSLHGQYPKLTEKYDRKKKYRWIRNGYMKKETEGLITAAQDQALPTRWRKVNIEKQGGTAKCRMCNERDETIFHILSECSKLAQSDYRKRHDKVAQNVHWNICKKFELPHAKNWYDHVAEKVTENNKAKVLWDFTIQTDHVIEARRPDIVVLDKELDHVWVIDIAVPGDGRVEEKEKEKREKYQDLAREIRKLWKTSVNVIPVVVGALGAVAHLEEELAKLDIGRKEVDRAQFSALLGSARILRRVLDI